MPHNTHGNLHFFFSSVPQAKYFFFLKGETWVRRLFSLFEGLGVSLWTAVTQARVFLARLKKSRLTLDCGRGQPGAMEVSPLPIKVKK